MILTLKEKKKEKKEKISKPSPISTKTARVILKHYIFITLGMCLVLPVLLFWRKVLLHWLKVSPAPLNTQLTGTVGGVWCRCLQPPLGASVLLTEVLQCCWVENGTTLISCSQTGGLIAPLHCSDSFTEYWEQSPLCVPQLSCIFYLPCGLYSKPKVLKDLALWESAPTPTLK